MTGSEWPALTKGEEALAQAGPTWGDAVVLTTPSPWLLAKPSLPDAIDVVFVEGNARAILEALAVHTRGRETVVGIGSGLVMDAAKFAAKRNGSRLIQAPSTSSNNACFTRTAWVMEDGKRSAERDCPIPEAIIVDRILLGGAPTALNRAGLAEILCSHTALFDWRLAHGAGRDVDWDPEIFAATQRELDGLEELAARVAGGDVSAFEDIIEACGRFAPWFSSHPRGRFNAGSEHIFAWGLEAHAGRRIVHGEAVALGTILMARLQDNAPEWPAAIVKAAGLLCHPDEIGVSWPIVEQTLRNLPNQARTVPWCTIIDGLGPPERASERLVRLADEARDLIDALRT